MMRVWRVGSISMGAALVFLGVFLLLSRFFNWDAAFIMAGWWPLLLIVIGGEILVYLFLSKQEKPTVKYDLLSIFFVGLIGTVGIGFTIFQATGLMDKLNMWMDMEEQTLDIPSYEYDVKNEIKRVVLDTGSHPLTIEGTSTSELSVFGTYRAPVVNGEKALQSPEDYLFSEVKGDTLYLTLKRVPHSPNPFNATNEMNATVVVPSDVQLEVSGNYSFITMKPRKLMSNWTVSNSGELNLQLSNESDILLSAENVNRLEGETKDWNMVEEVSGNHESEEYGDHSYEGRQLKSGTLKVGEGSSQLTVSNADFLKVTKVN
jgi:hypothetical protein